MDSDQCLHEATSENSGNVPTHDHKKLQDKLVKNTKSVSLMPNERSHLAQAEKESRDQGYRDSLTTLHPYSES